MSCKVLHMRQGSMTLRKMGPGLTLSTLSLVGPTPVQPLLSFAPLFSASRAPTPVGRSQCRPYPREVLLNDQSDQVGTDICSVCPWAPDPLQIQEWQSLGLRQGRESGLWAFPRLGSGEGMGQGRGLNEPQTASWALPSLPERDSLVKG